MADMIKASTIEIPDLPAPKVRVVPPNPISYEKEIRLRKITQLARDILEVGGILLEKGVKKVSGVEGFTFISSQTSLEEKKGLLIEILFHPLREEANPATPQKDPVAKFFFKGRSCTEKNWRVVSFLDHESWLREAEKLLPKSKQLMEAARSRKSSTSSPGKRKQGVEEVTPEDQASSGKLWLEGLHSNNDKQWEGRAQKPTLVPRSA